MNPGAVKVFLILVHTVSSSECKIEAEKMVNSPGSKGKPTYRAHYAKNDPPAVIPNLHRHPLTSLLDGRKSPETTMTNTDKAHIQNSGWGAAEAGEKITPRLCNHEDRLFTATPVSTSTRDTRTQDPAASGGKRKLRSTSPEPLPLAKRIHSTGEEGQEKRSQLERTDKYEYLGRRQLRNECLARSIPASGNIPDLTKRLRLDDAAQARFSSSQKSLKEKVASCTSLSAEPSDRYTHMLQKDLRKECLKRSLPVGLAKTDLRHCLRLYDAARALGLTPEESLEAQKATFEQHDGDCARVGENKLGATPEESPEEAVEGQPLGKVSRETVVNNGHEPPSLGSSEDDVSALENSQTSSEKAVGSSSATTQASSEGSNQDRGIPDMCLGPAATPNYSTMGQTELRSLCRSRSLMPNGLNASQLRVALTKYDNKLAEQAKNSSVEGDRTAELRVAKPVSPPPVTFIDLDSSSQDHETLEQQTPLVDASAPMRQEPLSHYLWTVNTGQRPPQSTNAQIGVLPRDRVSTEKRSEKAYVSPYSPLLVHKAPKTNCNGSTPRRTLYTEHTISQQQPLVSLINLTMKDTESDASESAHQETQKKTKPISELAIKMAEKENFNVKYANETPIWICCCDTPGYEVRQKRLAEFPAHCLYHVSHLAQKGFFTIKEYQKYIGTQQALGRIKSCLCEKPAIDHPEHQVIMTQGGFILAQIWREQLTRRQSLTFYRPDMSVYRRKGILEVMHNVHEDFMIELSSRQRKRPLVLWARIEAMAWFINTLPTSSEWHYFQDWKKPRHYIIFFGIALLTTINALLQQNLFKDKEPKVPNLGLVLALFIQSTWNSPSCTTNSFHSRDAYKSPFNNEICVNNENGWAAEVVSLADSQGVRIGGVKSIDFIVDRWRLRKRSFELIRDRARKEQHPISNNGEATLASIAAKEAETPKGKRVTWLPEDDYDDKGIRLWKKWFYLREFEIYTKE